MALAIGAAATSAAARSARSGFVTIHVAARHIVEGTEIGVDDVRTVEIPPEAVPAGLATRIMGRTATVPLLPGDPFLEAKLSPSGRGMSALLPAGLEAASVLPATPLDVAVGERVRITATFDPARYAGNGLVQVVAPNVLVLRSDEKDGRLVVALSPSQRDDLALAQATARIDVALVGPGARDP